MRVALKALQLTEAQRRAIAGSIGREGLASRETVRAWVSVLIEEELDRVARQMARDATEGDQS